MKNIYKKPIIFDEVCYEGNMDNRWGSLSGQEYLYRLWQGLDCGDLRNSRRMLYG